MPPLRANERASLPDRAFAYIDSRGRRRLPIHDAAHVRNALARFDQVAFEDEAARDRARIRNIVTAGHSRDDLDRALEAYAAVARDLLVVR